MREGGRGSCRAVFPRGSKARQEPRPPNHVLRGDKSDKSTHLAWGRPCEAVHDCGRGDRAAHRAAPTAGSFRELLRTFSPLHVTAKINACTPSHAVGHTGASLQSRLDRHTFVGRPCVWPPRSTRARCRPSADALTSRHGTQARGQGAFSPLAFLMEMSSGTRPNPPEIGFHFVLIPPGSGVASQGAPRYLLNPPIGGER